MANAAPPRGEALGIGEFARQEPLAVLFVLTGLVAWIVFLWWVIGGLA